MDSWDEFAALASLDDLVVGFATTALLVVSFLITCRIILNSFHLVPPFERRVLVDYRGGPPVVLESGLHFNCNLFLWALRPKKTSWRQFGVFPAVGRRFVVDPPQTQIHTKDLITGTVNVSVECQVTAWDAQQSIADNGCMYHRCCNAVNQWLSIQLYELEAAVCTYGFLSVYLNEAERIGNLNAALQKNGTCLSVVRVVLDQDGVSMDKRWVAQRNDINLRKQLLDEKEVVLKREAELERLQNQKEAAAAEFSISQKKRQVIADTENELLNTESETKRLMLKAERDLQLRTLDVDTERQRAKAESQMVEATTRLEADRVAGLLKAGLSANQVTHLLVAECHSKAMAQSTGAKYIAVPPGLIGMTPPTANPWQVVDAEGSA
eukprot:Sspe_Gene.29102::Locus_13612_Transcript_1_2_Confidence_0.667_Length_1548::g.29102::m.29102